MRQGLRMHNRRAWLSTVGRALVSLLSPTRQRVTVPTDPFIIDEFCIISQYQFP